MMSPDPAERWAGALLCALASACTPDLEDPIDDCAGIQTHLAAEYPVDDCASCDASTCPKGTALITCPAAAGFDAGTTCMTDHPSAQVGACRCGCGSCATTCDGLSYRVYRHSGDDTPLASFSAKYPSPDGGAGDLPAAGRLGIHLVARGKMSVQVELRHALAEGTSNTLATLEAVVDSSSFASVLLRDSDGGAPSFRWEDSAATPDTLLILGKTSGVLDIDCLVMGITEAP